MEEILRGNGVARAIAGDGHVHDQANGVDDIEFTGTRKICWMQSELEEF